MFKINKKLYYNVCFVVNCLPIEQEYDNIDIEFMETAILPRLPAENISKIDTY
jgi:hypothetical protein